MSTDHPLSSVTRWLLVVVGCAVLETAQPTKAAPADVVPSTTAAAAAESDTINPRSPETLLIPGGGSRGGIEAPQGPGSSSWIIVVGLCAGGFGWVWWRRRQETPGAKAGRQIQIEESRALGNRQYLVVATVGQKKFLLGVAPGSIQLLSPLEQGKETVYEPLA